MCEKIEIERLLIAAIAKGHYQRFPQRFEVAPSTGEWVKLSISTLDELEVSWSIQNTALMFINEIDTQKVWEVFFKVSIFKLVGDILEGKHFNDIVNNYS